jgi:hypothetical protein
LSTDTDGLGQIPLLHLEPLPHGPDGGLKSGVHARSIPEPDWHVNVTRLKCIEVYVLAAQRLPTSPANTHMPQSGGDLSEPFADATALSEQDVSEHRTCGGPERTACDFGGSP